MYSALLVYARQNTFLNGEKLLKGFYREFSEVLEKQRTVVCHFVLHQKCTFLPKIYFLLGKIYIFIPINWPAIVTPKFAKLILTKIMVTIWVCSKYREMVLEIMKVLVTVCDDTQNLNDTETEGSLKKKYSKPNPILLLIPNTSNLESNTFSM